MQLITSSFAALLIDVQNCQQPCQPPRLSVRCNHGEAKERKAPRSHLLEPLWRHAPHLWIRSRVHVPNVSAKFSFTVQYTYCPVFKLLTLGYDFHRPTFEEMLSQWVSKSRNSHHSGGLVGGDVSSQDDEVNIDITHMQFKFWMLSD